MLSLWVQPGARKTEPVAVVEMRLKLKLAAPPVEGKANDALVRWLSDRLDVPQRAVQLVSGQTSRQKRLRVACDLPCEAVVQRLDPDHQGRAP